MAEVQTLDALKSGMLRVCALNACLALISSLQDDWKALNWYA